MVVEISLLCSACDDEEKRTPIDASVHVTLDGMGAWADLCPEHKAQLIGPLAAFLDRHGRAISVPVEMETTSGVRDTRTKRIPSKAERTAADGSAVGGRVNNGGARPNSGRQRSGSDDDYPCIVPGCHHAVGTRTGLIYHLQHGHDDKMQLGTLFSRIRKCGLCGEPVASVRTLTIHALMVHGLTAAELVRTVRKMGDVETLSAMDTYIAKRLKLYPPDHSLVLPTDVTESNGTSQVALM